MSDYKGTYDGGDLAWAILQTIGIDHERTPTTDLNLKWLGEAVEVNVTVVCDPDTIDAAVRAMHDQPDPRP